MSDADVTAPPPTPADDFELRLFLEEICCNLCRFGHVRQDSCGPERVRIDQEVFLGTPGAFADIRVQAPGIAPYFVEVKFGYTPDRVVRTLARKYGKDSKAQADAARVVLVYDAGRVANFDQIVAQIQTVLRPGLALEVWDERKLLDLIREQFGVQLDGICASDLLDVRDAVDRAQGAYAFGPDYQGTNLGSSLLWHLGYWRIRHLRERQKIGRA